MKIHKPAFWDYKKPNFLAYLLKPFSFLVLLRGYFKRKKIRFENIKTICVGNIYLGGTGKTPTSIMLNEIVKSLNYKTCFIKKFYTNQKDEQLLLKKYGRLFCEKERITAVKIALKYNKEGISAILEFCLKSKSKIIYAGSSTKFGDGGLGRNQSPYSWTKSSNTEWVSNCKSKDAVPLSEPRLISNSNRSFR